MLGPAREPGAGLGHPELHQQFRLLTGRRRLIDRPAQKEGGGLGGAVPGCGARGFDQPLDDPAVGGGFADQQVLGDVLVRARLLGE